MKRNKLTGSQAAALAGVQPGTWRRYTTPNRSRGGKLHGPAPDGHCDPCGCPWWWEETILRFKAEHSRTKEEQ